MKLVDLDPKFVGNGGPGAYQADGAPAPQRHGVGLSFRCPCGQKHPNWDRVFVCFENPLDGGPPMTGVPRWQRTGETFQTITLSPSIQRMDEGGCGWHGHVTNGETRTCS